jgi:hypothetical protein
VEENEKKEKRRFAINRFLIILMVAAILGGLLLDHWGITLLNARLL